jgi:hypothetical protein
MNISPSAESLRSNQGEFNLGSNPGQSELISFHEQELMNRPSPREVQGLICVSRERKKKTPKTKDQEKSEIPGSTKGESK